MTRLPQVTAPGAVLAYNNAGLVVATGSTLEEGMENLLLDPRQLSSTRYFTDQIIGLNVAASRNVIDGKPVVDTGFCTFPRSCDPTGALMSSPRDQLCYARFHL